MRHEQARQIAGEIDDSLPLRLVIRDPGFEQGHAFFRFLTLGDSEHGEQHLSQ